VYPLILEQLSPEVALWIPDTEAIKSEYEKLKIQEPNLAFPFWAKIWASSKAMVTFLQEEPHWIEKKEYTRNRCWYWSSFIFNSKKGRQHYYIRLCK